MMSQSLRGHWSKLSTKIDNLSTRERAVVLILCLAVVYMVWDLIIFTPLSAEKAKVDESLSAVELNIQDIKKEEVAIKLAANADPDQELKKQLTNLDEQLKEIDENLETLSLGLVPVDQLSEILYEVLDKTGQLQLDSMQTLPVEEISLTSSNPSENQAIGAGIYKHNVLLRVRGNFHELMTYLQQLENMSWRFYWDELLFKEDSYPNSIIELKVYTLSTNEGLFGV